MQNFKFKKKLIIFDLDGVLIDSKKNMKFAWNHTSEKYHLKISFNKYFKEVGKPFDKILKNLKIKKNISLITKNFSDISKANLNLIKPYPNLQKVLNYLENKNIKIALVTSKDYERTKKILKKLKIKIKTIQCPSKKLRGKPYPDQINKVIKKLRITKKKCVYIGDAKVDLEAAKSARIDFLFASYGYKIGISTYENKVKNLTQIKKII